MKDVKGKTSSTSNNDSHIYIYLSGPKKKEEKATKRLTVSE